MEYKLNSLIQRIEDMKRIGEAIAQEYKEIPAVDRNIKRILASLRILELDVSDLKMIQD